MPWKLFMVPKFTLDAATCLVESDSPLLPLSTTAMRSTNAGAEGGVGEGQNW